MRYEASEEDRQKIESAFTYHPPKSDQADRYIAIRDHAKEMALIAVSLCPPSRELSLAITALENAVMWMNASIARRE